MSIQIQETVCLTYEPIVCGAYSVRYYIPTQLYESRLSDGRCFFCPNGHQRVFRETTASKLAKASQELAALRSQLGLERDQKAATEKSLELLKKRIGKGVCPCCHRTVKQLQRHIETKHPEWPK